MARFTPFGKVYSNLKKVIKIGIAIIKLILTMNAIISFTNRKKALSPYSTFEFLFNKYICNGWPPVAKGVTAEKKFPISARLIASRFDKLIDNSFAQ